MYALGIDLGTTYTAAAVWRNGRAEIVSLGGRTAAIPSVVLLREDETFLTGEAANRRGLTEPSRVAREFKRRIGDTTPIMLGGTPHSAESLTSRLLRSVVEEVVKREGGPPASVCVSHPANWGPYKIDLLGQAVRMADLPSVLFATEPEAAAMHYAQEQRLGVGAVVAVYDLGGGTFDAAVLRRTASGFAILGKPEGIERLGGIDFDAAVFNHVRTALGNKLDELDEDDAAAITAVARLREECVQAKEALSADTDTSIPVLLPSVTTDVRLTRGEFEAMVRPALHGSIEALQRAVRSAGITPEQLHSVLLVGGSSRMPIVGQLVSAELGRPVAVDTHPKHAVALGAAWRAGTALAGPAKAPPLRSPAGPPAGQPAGPPPADRGGVGPTVGLGAAAAGLAAGGLAAGAAGPPPRRPTVQRAFPSEPVTRRPQGPPPRGPAPQASRSESAPEPLRRAQGSETRGMPAGRSSAPPAEPIGPPKTEKTDRRKRMLALGVAAAVAVLLAGGAAALGVFDTKNTAGTGTPPATAANGNSPLPPDEQCTEEIMSNPRWVCLTAAVVVNGQLTMNYVSDGGPLNIDGGDHLHIYGGDGTIPADRVMGEQVPEAQRGKWYVEDRRPAVLDLTDQRYLLAIGDQPKVCARVATADHKLVKAEDGSYRTGNCIPVDRTAAATTTKKAQPTRDKGRPHPTTTTTESTTPTTTTETPPDSDPDDPSAPADATPAP